MKTNSGPQIIVAFLMIATIVSACNGSTSTPVSIAQNPTIHISSASISPDKTIHVCVGETVALVTNATGTDLTYTWSVDGNGQLKPTGGKGDAGSSSRYTAPASASEDVVKVTVTDVNNQSTSDQVVIEVAACPTPTPTPDPPTLVITSPKNGDVVTMTIPITGTVAKASMTGGRKLYVIVRSYGYEYWVQPPQPIINSDGTWNASPIGVGTETDPGHSFDICAVLTSETITSTNPLPALPSGPASCNTVTRK
jgi:hypothetical protein